MCNDNIIEIDIHVLWCRPTAAQIDIKPGPYIGFLEGQSAVDPTPKYSVVASKVHILANVYLLRFQESLFDIFESRRYTIVGTFRDMNT